MNYYRPFQRAPYSTCPKCGQTSRDWGFKYRNLCNKCHKEWRKEHPERFKNSCNFDNMLNLANEIVITEYVYNRLRRKAEQTVGCTTSYLLSRVLTWIIILSALILIQYHKNAYIYIIIPGGFLAFTNAVFFTNIWNHKVQQEVVKLAVLQEKEIEEQKRFYVSAEWRNVRQQILENNECVCSMCGKFIKNDFDLTVDHIKPRSKFPELALKFSNLQVLCRSCNSKKGDIYLE